MPSGGRRDNAGRKKGTTALSNRERDCIGSACARINRTFMRLRAARQSRQVWDDSDQLRALRTKYEQLHAFDPEVRARRRHTERDEALEDVRALRDEFGSQILKVEMARSYRTREKILRRVAKLASRHLGRTVTQRMVRTCWEDFSKLEEEVRDHLNSARFD
jgi:hypothetical protein